MIEDEIASAPMDSMEALKLYSKHFGENNQDKPGLNKVSFPWSTNEGYCQSEEQQEDLSVYAELESNLVSGKNGKKPRAFGSRSIEASEYFEEDSDGEQVQLCQHCLLPLGHAYYKKASQCLHGECVAPDTLNDMRQVDEARLRSECAEKKKRHKEYGIGWDVEHIPRNDRAARKFSMRDVPQGMVCVVLEDGEEQGRNIRLASTLEPVAALNLEYLSTALAVRRREGREPVFSLDPVSTAPNAMQAKRFVPEWLAGTSAGDVLFQADYHLKELSMGEFDQPVVGMKSCFEYSELEEAQAEWSARQWFMVRKAEVHISPQSVLLPFVKMGVEAREQVIKGDSLEDKQLTRPDHPMVRYAEAFTNNFDLIAERKSVVHHLRELAKASVIAKYLLDSNVQLEESWFDLATGDEGACSMEVPQLWNERMFANVDVEIQDGMLSRQDNSRMHGVYGGVQFGLDKFNLARMATTSRAPAAGLSATMQQHRITRFAGIGAAPKLATSMAPPVTRFPGIGAAPKLATSMAPPGGSIAASRFPTGVSKMPKHRLAGPFATGPRMATTMHQPGRLQGVDLRLDKFDLSEAKRVVGEAQEGSWSGEPKSLDECVSIGDAFWANLEKDSDVFNEDDRSLLREIFCPKLSDRRSEGELFTPPDASHSYVTRLRALVKEEESVRQRRKAHFFSQSFSMDKPSALFPFSWKSSFQSKVCAEQRPLLPHPEYLHKATELLKSAPQDSSCIFDKSTEEGIRFRIYALGALEVRTMQVVNGDGQEVVGGVFSTKKHAEEGVKQAVEDYSQERVVKATEYVERTSGAMAAKPGAHRCYYVVLETEGCLKIRMEQLATGKTTFELEPTDLEDRNSLAKVVQSGGCRPGLLVAELKSYQILLARGNVMSKDLCSSAASPATRKRHAQNIFARATGAAAPAPCRGASVRAPMLMNSFMAPHLTNKKTTFVPTKHDALDNAIAKCRASKTSLR